MSTAEKRFSIFDPAIRFEHREFYERIVSDMKAHGIDLPIVAIGGILKSDIADIMQTGVTGIAVSGGILNAESPAEEMKQFISLIKPNR